MRLRFFAVSLLYLAAANAGGGDAPRRARDRHVDWLCTGSAATEWLPPMGAGDPACAGLVDLAMLVTPRFDPGDVETLRRRGFQVKDALDQLERLSRGSGRMHLLRAATLEDAVDILAPVQAFNGRQQFGGARQFRGPEFLAVDADLLASLHLPSNIYL